MSSLNSSKLEHWTSTDSTPLLHRLCSTSLGECYISTAAAQHSSHLPCPNAGHNPIQEEHNQFWCWWSCALTRTCRSATEEANVAFNMPSRFNHSLSIIVFILIYTLFKQPVTRFPRPARLCRRSSRICLHRSSIVEPHHSMSASKQRVVVRQFRFFRRQVRTYT